MNETCVSYWFPVEPSITGWIARHVAIKPTKRTERTKRHSTQAHAHTLTKLTRPFRGALREHASLPTIRLGDGSSSISKCPLVETDQRYNSTPPSANRCLPSRQPCLFGWLAFWSRDGSATTAKGLWLTQASFSSCRSLRLSHWNLCYQRQPETSKATN